MPSNRAFVYIDYENIPMTKVLGSCIDRLTQDKELNLISIKVFEKYFESIPLECKKHDEWVISLYNHNKLLNDLYIKHNIDPIQCLETKSGKNSIDMKIVSTIHNDLKNCKFNIAVLFTNDRDFVEVCHTCKEQGKQVWIVGDTCNISKVLKDYCDLFIDYNDPYNYKLENSHIIVSNDSNKGKTNIAKNHRSLLNEFLIKYFIKNNVNRVRLSELRSKEDIFKLELDHKLLGYTKFRIMIAELLNKKKFTLEILNSSDVWVVKI